MSHLHPLSRASRRTLAAVTLGAALVAVPATAGAKTTKLKVMTRNVYLGADLTAGVQAGDLQGLADAAGAILNQVDQNKFAVRAKGLAAEIRSKGPDLVGLQEVAEWRTAPCSQSPLPPKAATVRYDYLKSLLTELNRGKKRYRLVIAEPEFDFEVYANTDGNRSTAGPNCPLGSEINGRLTMRDVILARVGNVRTAHARAGHFSTLLQERPAGINVNVTRGWTRVDAHVGSGRTFRFVNTHLEAFDSQAANHTNKSSDLGNGEIRAAQAKELVAAGGPANSRLPVILVGDLNSDTTTKVKPGDELAYQALIGAGFAERSAPSPLGCCLNSPVLTSSGGGKLSDLDHKVDHIMTDAGKRVRLVGGAVTGRTPVNGFWDSDHAGLFSALTIR